jgi:hypothetical protein
MWPVTALIVWRANTLVKPRRRVMSVSLAVQAKVSSQQARHLKLTALPVQQEPTALPVTLRVLIVLWASTA